MRVAGKEVEATFHTFLGNLAFEKKRVTYLLLQDTETDFPPAP